MKDEMKKAILSANTDVVMLDIDGTIKDLVKEHSDSLRITINGFVRGKSIRKRFVLFLDKIAMGFVKAGVFSTNSRKQKFLLNLYAFILGINKKEFCKFYNIFYEETLIVFDDAKEVLGDIVKNKRVYFVTINSQNYNLEGLGIARDDIICAKFKNKLDAYKKVIFENKINPDRVMVVGDNLIDDIRPAKKLGCKYLLVDNYNSKLKRFVAKLLNVGM